jgi:hypothetical protein
MVMWSFPRLLAGLVLVACAARVAGALTLDAATITMRTTRADTFQLKGRVSPLSLDGAEAIVVTLDRIAVRIPLADVKRKKQIVTYRDRSPHARVSRLRLDLKKGRFLVAGDGWTLADLPNPLAVGIGTDVTAECRMTRLRTIARRRATRRVLGPNRGDDGACGVVAIPSARPVVVTVGTPTPVRFEVDVAGSIDALQVVGADGTPLCTLAQDAGSRFACTATITASEPTTLALVVRGTAGGAAVSSPGFGLPIVPPRTDADRALVVSAGGAAQAAWSEISARLGDTLDARMELLRVLSGIPGIGRAGLSPNGVDVVFRYDTGWMGALILNREPVAAAPAATAVSRPVRHAAATSSLRPAPRGIFRTCPTEAPDAICCQLPDRRKPLLGRRVLIWDPGFFRPIYDDALLVEQKFAALPCLEHQITKIDGANATVASVRQFSNAETLVISTHGAVDEYGRVMFGTGELITEAGLALHEDDLTAGFVETGGMHDMNGVRRDVFTVTEAFLRYNLPSRFPERAIVYASYCFSGYGTGVQAFVDAGAGTAFGYDWKVSEDYAKNVAGQLFDGLISQFQTTGDAYDAVTPKIDPTPRTGDIPGQKPNTWLSFRLPAVFTYEGDERIAYVGQPDVEPDASTVPAGESATLTATAEGKGTCELNYHWHTAGVAGDLSGDGGTNDFESTEPTATYTANEEPEEGLEDEVGVELLSPDRTGAIGTGCAAANVVTTTTTSTTSTSTTVPSCGAGVVMSADVTEEIHAAAQANDLMGPGDQTDPYNLAQNTITVGPGTTDTKPWDLSASAGGAEATSSGSITYTIAPCSITAHGTFAEASVGGSAVGNAVTGLDTTLQIAFKVSRYTPYTLTGSVRASGTPNDAGPTVVYLRCSGHFGIVDASLAAPTGVAVPFGEEGALYPEDNPIILCAAKRGGSSTDASPDDMGTLEWSFTIDFE